MIIQHHNKVRDWIKKGEGDQLEFKVMISEPYKVAKAICAFANTRGGYLLSGISDDGEIVGVVEPEMEIKKLNDAATLYCVPPVSISIRQHLEDFLVVVAVYIEESSFKPHKALTKNGSEQAYIRVGNKTMPAGKLVVKVIKNEYKNHEEDESHLASLKLDSKESGLLDYLKKREKITLKQFARLVNISERRARRILVKLTLAGYIRLHTQNKDEFYTLS
ncbi:MAG: putative DNA binding domain-containing protein [Sphingobacteriales bacterium]|nr:MAG: putative DNA binding domain-containing protein [Sphingobacteriales bacterium]